jgi:pilus assembly protein CpaE
MRPAGPGSGERGGRPPRRTRTRGGAKAALHVPCRARARGDRGQVSVELLGITPLILLVLLLVWQFVLLGYTFTLAGDAADRAARAVAVGEDPTAAAERDLPSAWASGAAVSTGGSGDVVTAHVALRVPVLVPGFAAFPFTVDGDAGAAKEQP